jgi:hypothetical protein
MKVSIDRIEQGIAVLIPQEDPRKHITVPAGLLPAGCREGDILSLTLEADPGATVAAKDRARSLIGRLQKKS